MDVQRFASSGRTPHFAAPVHTFIRARKGWLLSRGERTLGGVGVFSYDIRKRPWSLIWGATNRLNPTLIQRCGQPDALHILTDNSQEAVLHSKVVFTGMTICLSMSHHPISAHKIHANLGSLSMLFWHVRLYICLLMMFYLGCTEEPGWSKGDLHSLELHATLLTSLCEQWKARRVL